MTPLKHRGILSEGDPLSGAARCMKEPPGPLNNLKPANLTGYAFWKGCVKSGELTSQPGDSHHAQEAWGYWRVRMGT